jgi:hypothetical protein
MRHRIRVAIAIAVLICPSVAVALTRKMSQYHFRVHTYAGTDPAGKVRFGVYTNDPQGAGTYAVRNLTFANKCAPLGSTVVAVMPINAKGRFWYKGDGFTISGAFSGPSYATAAGTAAVVMPGCSSGGLRFSAKPITAPKLAARSD